MASLTTALDTIFTPTGSVFRVQVNGRARLVSRNSASVSTWDPVVDERGAPAEISGVVQVSNDIAGAQYMLSAVTSGTTVAVDE